MSLLKGSDAEKICEILNRHDPEGLIKFGAPADEYHSEAIVLLCRVCDQPLTKEYVRDVWLVFFASGTTSGGPPHSASKTRRYVGDMPMRPEFKKIADEINALFPQREK